MNLICRIWGHQLNEDAAYYYSVYSCDRCGDVYEDECGIREWLRIRKFLIAQAVRQRWQDLCEWFKCGECGHRFGKHDDSDHLPF